VNFPGDVNNPILAPTGPLNQFILGPQAASLLVLGLTPTVSAQVTDRLAVAAGPMVDISLVSFDPAFFGPTSQANPLAPRQFPTGSHTRPFWGGGFKVGTTYKITEQLYAGFSYMSKQWFETWRFNARDANGNPIEYSTSFSLPQIFSLGLAYSGIERLLLAADVRYFDYAGTDLLGTRPVDGGAGWRSIWSVAVGSRYCVTDRLSVQVGYVFNENPISSNLTLFNTELPAITMHTISAGTYFQINESIGLSLAYIHGFNNTVSGSVTPLLGTTTAIQSEYDSFAFGLHIAFGPCGRCMPQDSTCCAK
jgi:long-chain fatty acid transport protein